MRGAWEQYVLDRNVMIARGADVFLVCKLFLAVMRITDVNVH